MLHKILITFSLWSLLTFQTLSAANVGLLIMATGRYIEFIEPLVASAKKHFCADHEVTYFVYTDGVLPPMDNVVSIYQKRLGWPYDTMKRNYVYLKSQDAFKEMDYLFACDSDMLFVDTVGEEIFGERVATISPGFASGSPFPRKRGAFETKPQSMAYVRDDEGNDYYFAGGFFGGTTKEFLKILEVTNANIDKDLEKGIIAEWHDESHWNRYCIDNPPTVILSPSYCYPENWKMPYVRRLLALDKDHAAIRE
jgi:histo-blood group ABO system transferase